MRTRRKLNIRYLHLLFILTVGLQAAVLAQPRSPKGSILGVWRGTSICTKVVGNEACNDEIVVYEFVNHGHSVDTVTMRANKVVNGKVVPMGDLDFTYKPRQKRWTGEFQNSRVHILWSFELHGNQLTGTCADLPSLLVRRNVSASKDTVLQSHTAGEPLPRR